MRRSPLYAIRYTRLAEQCFEDQIHHLTELRDFGQDAALKVVGEIIDDIEQRLGDMPDSYPISPEASELGVTQFRRMLCGNYRVLYQVNENAREVAVILVLHSRQDVEKALIRYCLLAPFALAPAQ